MSLRRLLRAPATSMAAGIVQSGTIADDRLESNNLRILDRLLYPGIENFQYLVEQGIQWLRRAIKGPRQAL